MSQSGQKRTVLSIEEKGAIIARISNGESNVAIATELGLAHSTISTIWKNREKIKAAFNDNVLAKKKLRPCEHPDLDAALLQWFKNKRAQGVSISGPILLAKANDFAAIQGKENFKCSESWITRFRARHNIVFGKISGESGSVQPEVTQNWLETVWPEIRKGFKDDEIFNADETGLFFKITPDRTLKFRGEKCQGGKMSKERITVLVTANMTGTVKKKLLVIGKSKKPRCFKNINRLPVIYRHNKRAWMVSDLFQEFLTDWDNELFKSKQKILLLVDNCPAHPAVRNLKAIKLCFLPPNTTSVLQPLDQGIIRAMKVYFRQCQVMKMIENADKNVEFNINLLDAICMISKAWDKVSGKTIANCFKHAGFLPSENLSTVNDFEDEDNVPLAELKNIMTSWQEIMPSDQFENLVTVDNDVATWGEMTDEDLVASTLNTEEIGDDEDDADSLNEMEFEPPTIAEALKATATLRNFISFNNSLGEDSMNHVISLEKNLEDIYFSTLKQTKITDFFKHMQPNIN